MKHEKAWVGLQKCTPRSLSYRNVPLTFEQFDTTTTLLYILHLHDFSFNEHDVICYIIHS